MAQVPLDYDRPRGPTTGIALARFGAADPAHKIGTVFVNPGGPGGSGVGLVLAGFGECGRQIDSDRVSTAREFAEFLRLCDEAGADCPLTDPDGAAARYQALAEALRDQPLVIDETIVYSYDYLVSDTTDAMYVPEYWGGHSGYAALFAALPDAVLGDEPAAGRSGAIRLAIRDRLRQATPQAADYDNGLDAFCGVLCADTEFPRSLAEFRRISAFAESGSFFGPLWWWDNAPCARWPVAADRYAGPWTARTAAPVLVVGNVFDGITGYDAAVASSRLLPGSRLLTYAGWGHTAFTRSACATDYIAAYLLTAALPPPDTICPANPNPFLSQGSVAMSAARLATAPAPTPAVPMVGLPPSRPSLR